MFGDHIKQELNYTSDLNYYVLGGGIGRWECSATVEYTLSHMGLTASEHKNVSRSCFPAGHMVYVDDVSMQKLKAMPTRSTAAAARREGALSGT